MTDDESRDKDTDDYVDVSDLLDDIQDAIDEGKRMMGEINVANVPEKPQRDTVASVTSPVEGTLTGTLGDQFTLTLTNGQIDHPVIVQRTTQLENVTLATVETTWGGVNGVVEGDMITLPIVYPGDQISIIDPERTTESNDRGCVVWSETVALNAHTTRVPEEKEPGPATVEFNSHAAYANELAITYQTPQGDDQIERWGSTDDGRVRAGKTIETTQRVDPLSPVEVVWTGVAPVQGAGLHARTATYPYRNVTRSIQEPTVGKFRPKNTDSGTVQFEYIGETKFHAEHVVITYVDSTGMRRMEVWGRSSWVYPGKAVETEHPVKDEMPVERLWINDGKLGVHLGAYTPTQTHR